MALLTWDGIGQRLYETGVDHGVLYVPNAQGVYNTGVAWNGLTTVTESPSGAESNPQYADNIKYLNLVSAEEFGATIEAFTYPDAFAQCDGSVIVNNGVVLGQQSRRSFGFSYRTLVGNDTMGRDFGYKIHLVYGALAAPSEKANATVNDSPEAAALSWEVTTTAVAVGTVNSVAYKPVAHLVVDSTKVTPANLATLEGILYGAPGVDPRLPLPAEVIGFFSASGASTAVAVPIASPSSTAAGVVTIPTHTGVDFLIDGVIIPAGTSYTLPAIGRKLVVAQAKSGYTIPADTLVVWQVTRTV
jgi:hypothetical protein